MKKLIIVLSTFIVLLSCKDEEGSIPPFTCDCPKTGRIHDTKLSCICNVYDGDTILYTQQQVNEFKYIGINGNLDISESDINDLSKLKGLAFISGNLHIYFTSLTSLEGLNNLESIGGDLLIDSNDSLTSLKGLYDITFISGDLNVWNNPILKDYCAIPDEVVSGKYSISNNNMGNPCYK